MTDIERIKAFRRILPQVIATIVENLHQIDMGYTSAMPVVIIGALCGSANEANRNEPLSMTGSQASWLGSIAFLILPFGSFASGFISDHLGRKRSMMLVNVPFVMGWIMLYKSAEVWHIFVGGAFLTLAASLVKSTMVTYISEICEPSMRSILIGSLNTSISLGLFIAFVLNTLIPWRMVALIGLTMPLLSTAALCFIPETPQWLFSKNRISEAEKSLCWLRGWVSKQTLATEFRELQRYSKRSKSCNACIKQDLHCLHPPPTFIDKLTELKRKRNLKPFMVLIPWFFLTQFTGLQSMGPFMVQIFNAYESPIRADQATAIMGFIDNLAHVAFICFVRCTGKRRLYLMMAAGVVLSSLIVSVYGFICMPSGFISFNRSKSTFHLENSNLAYIPTICLFLWEFCSKCGFLAMPWMLISELFPFKTRGIAIGVAAAINFTFAFVSKKTYYNLETMLSLHGYCAISCIGLILMYFILPETEGRSLEDIELHFSDNSKTITEWKIAKNSTPEKSTKLQRCENGENMAPKDGIV